jgi:RNA polymerase sigma factor (sigma-70 family)
MARLADARLLAVIRAMPERQFLVAVMRFGGGMTLAEIAAEMGISRATAGREVKRVREILLDAAGNYVDLGWTD